MGLTKRFILLTLLLLTVVSLTSCQKSELENEKIPHIKYSQIKTTSFDEGTDSLFQDDIEIEIINSNEAFNSIDLSFQRELDEKQENQVMFKLSSLVLYKDGEIVENNSVKMNIPDKYTINYDSSPYTFHVGEYRFDVFVSKDTIYTIQLTSTK